jgi:hypothetical protein
MTVDILERLFGPDDGQPTIGPRYDDLPMGHTHVWTEHEAAGITYWECHVNPQMCRAIATDPPQGEIE